MCDCVPGADTPGSDNLEPCIQVIRTQGATQGRRVFFGHVDLPVVPELLQAGQGKTRERQGRGEVGPCQGDREWRPELGLPSWGWQREDTKNSQEVKFAKSWGGLRET